MQKTIELGSTVKDLVTGFQGIVNARAIHLNGCDRYWVEPPVKKDGTRADGAWHDVTTLKTIKGPSKELLAMTQPEPTEQPARKPGGFTSTVK